MRIAASVMLGTALLWGVALAAPRRATPPVPAADDAARVRGVALGLFASDPDWDYGPLVEEIAARGATDVLVVVNAYQSNRFASDIGARAGHSATQATVARTLRQVGASGMRAALMPVVRLSERAPHEWRGVIAPADGLDAWFEAYEGFVLPLARIAAAEGVHRFVVGSELGSLERYEARWRRLIHEVRGVFPGRLTYSANWDHASEVPFWDALDELGLTGYFPLAAEGAASEDSIAKAWRAPVEQMRVLAERNAKPVLVTEVGYPSRPTAASRPWDDSGSSVEVDLGAQQRLYRAFCAALSEAPRVSGFYAWNWFGFGGPRDAGFTPRGKPAAAELAACFARPWRAGAIAGNE